MSLKSIVLFDRMKFLLTISHKADEENEFHKDQFFHFKLFKNVTNCIQFH